MSKQTVSRTPGLALGAAGIVMLFVMLFHTSSAAGPLGAVESEPLIPLNDTEFTESSPVMFIENVGQFDKQARFQVRGGIGTMWVADDGVWITLLERKEIGDSRLEIEGAGTQSLISQATRALPQSPTPGVNLKLTFPNANPHPRIEPFDRLETKVSYFIGNDPEKWRPDVPVWAGVRYVDLYPGVDLEITSEAGHWTWRLVFHNPQSPISNIQLRVAGADTLTLAGDTLRLTTAVGDLTLPLLQGVSYDGVLLDLLETSPKISGTDITFPFSSSASRSSIRLFATHPLPQDDPSDLLYSTFLGGSGADGGWAIAVGETGSVYVTGWTDSPDFPATPGAFDGSYNGCGSSVSYCDAFVVKLNPSGTGLAYATFLGGNGSDYGVDIAVDRAGNTYVTGYTGASDFPTTSAAFDTSYNGGDRDAFVIKLDASGTRLIYATLLGGSGYDYGLAIAVDGADSAFVTGGTGSSNFPTTSGAFDTSRNGGDAFVVRLNAEGSGLAYATFLGGREYDDTLDIALDGAGNAYVTGYTGSSNFPTTAGAFDTTYNGGKYDAFVVKVNAAGTGVTYGTFLGSSGWDEGNEIVVDREDNAYVVGETDAFDFPTTREAFDTSYNGCGIPRECDAFVVKLNPAGTELIYATFLGGSGSESGTAINLDGAGDAYVAGYTGSSNFPTTTGAFDTSYNGGGYDAFVVKLTTSGTGLVYATFLGGSSDDHAWAIDVDGVGDTYVTGPTNSPDFSTILGGFDTSHNGNRDAFVAKLAMGGETDVFVAGVEPIQAVEGAPLIAGKRTGIKVSLGVNGSNGAGNVRIKILHDGDEFSTFYPRVSENLDIGGYLKRSTTRIDIPPGGSPLDVYFFPPSDFWPQTAGTYRITAVVEADGDTDLANNQLTTERSTRSTEWGENEELHLFFAPIEEQQDYYAADWVSFVERTFPISELDVKARYSSSVVSVPRKGEIACLSLWPQNRDKIPRCRKAQLLMEVFRRAEVAEPETDRAVAITPPNWLGEGVVGQMLYDPLTGRLIVEAVLLDVDAAPHSLAHELGHTYGLYLDPECEQYDPDCDESTPHIPGAPVDGGLDPTFRELKEHALTAGGVRQEVYDFMGSGDYEPPELDRWVTLDTYQRLITAATRTAGTRSIGSKNKPTDVQAVLVLGGMVKADGELTLDSYYLLPDGKPSDLPPDGDVLIQLRRANDQVLYQGGLPSSVRFTDGDSSQLDGVPLAVAVPFPEDTRHVTISLFGEELDRRVVSVNPPTVTVLSPQPGETVDDEIQVSWQASDPDGDPVTVAVLLSADNGQTWQTVAMDMEVDSYSIDTRSLQAGSAYWVKLIATDGVRTGVATSGPFKILKDVYLPVVARNHSSAGPLHQSSTSESAIRTDSMANAHRDRGRHH